MVVLMCITVHAIYMNFGVFIGNKHLFGTQKVSEID